MADRTELIQKLRNIEDLASEGALDLRDLAYIEETARDAAELLENSTILRHRLAAERPAVAVGQVWQNRRSNRYVRVAQLIRGIGGTSVRWESLHDRGRQGGYCGISTLNENYDYVETPKEGTDDR